MGKETVPVKVSPGKVSPAVDMHSNCIRTTNHGLNKSHHKSLFKFAFES